MKAMILAAGLGTRMEELTRDCPKPMLPLLGVPLIAHTLFLLHRHGCSFAAINTYYLGGQIQDFLKDFPFFPLQFSEEPILLGTGGGISRALRYTDLGDFFWVVNPDSIYLPRFSLKEIGGLFSDLFQADGRAPAPLLCLDRRAPGSQETGFSMDAPDSPNAPDAPDSPNAPDAPDDPHAPDDLESPGLPLETSESFPSSGAGNGLSEGSAWQANPGGLPEFSSIQFSASGAFMYTGMALLHESQFEHVPFEEPFHIVDDWKGRAERNELMGYRYHGQVLDLGRKKDYLQLRNSESAFALTYREELSQFMHTWKKES